MHAVVNSAFCVLPTKSPHCGRLQDPILTGPVSSTSLWLRFSPQQVHPHPFNRGYIVSFCEHCFLGAPLTTLLNCFNDIIHNFIILSILYIYPSEYSSPVWGKNYFYSTQNLKRCVAENYDENSHSINGDYMNSTFQKGAYLQVTRGIK